MNKRKGINNILRVYSLATEQDKTEGLAWYREARAFCESMSAKYGVSVDVAIACLSALSPRNKWNSNLRNVEAVLKACQEGRGPESVRVGTFNNNKEKAFRIVRENKPELAQTSPKTAAFASNIRDLESKEVTVDIHAFSIFFGFRAEPGTLTPTHYKTIADAYRSVAKKIGMRPYELQAVCWVIWRRYTANDRVVKVRPRDYDKVAKLKLAA